MRFLSLERWCGGVVLGMGWEGMGRAAGGGVDGWMDGVGLREGEGGEGRGGKGRELWVVLLGIFRDGWNRLFVFGEEASRCVRMGDKRLTYSGEEPSRCAGMGDI